MCTQIPINSKEVTRNEAVQLDIGSHKMSLSSATIQSLEFDSHLLHPKFLNPLNNFTTNEVTWMFPLKSLEF